MYRYFRRIIRLVLVSVVFIVIPAGLAAEDYEPLRVASDPNNMPLSHRDLGGFENKIAELIAKDMGASVQYTWWGQRRGFIRNTLKATLNEARADIVLGVPKGYDLVSLTRPYYRSTYVFVYPESSGYSIKSLDDPILKELKIGVHLLGNDYMNPPPVHELGRRGIVEMVVGFNTFYTEENPPGKIIEAVVSGEVDMAIVWGPLAGYYAARQTVPLLLVPIPSGVDDLPFAFDICMGVRHGEKELKSRLEAALERKHAEIKKILAEYGVPLLPIESAN